MINEGKRAAAVAAIAEIGRAQGESPAAVANSVTDLIERFGRDYPASTVEVELAKLQDDIRIEYDKANLARPRPHAIADALDFAMTAIRRRRGEP